MRRFAVVLLTLLIMTVVSDTGAFADRRVALVIGNSAYQHTTVLANPLNDARDLTAALKSVGFEVIEAVDADKRALDGALRTFADQVASADVALFFYAGHGLQVGTQNYLVPVDARLQRERDLEFEAVRLDFVLRQMEIDREGKTSIVILDACRDNPLSRNLARTMGTRSTAIGQGLAATSTGLGTFIAYSTQPGNVALDGKGRNSPFTDALVRNIAVKGRNLPSVMIEVRKDVVAATGGRQVPWDHSALTGDFYFVPATGAKSETASAPVAPAAGSVDVAALQERLSKLENEARQRASDRTRVTAASPAGVVPARPKAAAAGEPRSYQIDENVRIDGLKIDERRQPNPAACRDWCESEANCVAFQHGRRSPVMGQCHLFARVDARQEDRSWRSGVRSDASVPEEAEVTRTAPADLATQIRATLTRKEQGFDIYEGMTMIGSPLKMSTSDSNTGCQVVCRNTPGCVAATYNAFFRGKNVACLVFGTIAKVAKSPTSTLMVRSH